MGGCHGGILKGFVVWYRSGGERELGVVICVTRDVMETEKSG